MENKQMKCIKGESCLYCGSTYCRFIDELDQLKEQLQAEKEKVKELENKLKTYFNIDNQECWDLAFFKNENAKYKQALTEIKEIAKYPFPPNLSAQSCYDSYNAFRGHILQKCEVLDD